MHPDIVPNHLTHPINKKILLLILGLAILFQAYVNLAPKTQDTEHIISIVSIINPLIASVAAFLVVKRYGSSVVFGKAYAALGTGLFMLFLGEVTWYYFAFVLEVEPFPSIADLFFYLFYPLSAIHIILNVRFFHSKISLIDKFWICTIPVAISLAYSILALNQIGEANFDFYYGLVFVLSTSIVLALSLLGVVVFRGGALGIVWVLLLLGILLTSIGDVWYFYLELLEEYESGHLVELLWYAGYWIIFYALYKHRKII
jgi:hypothetical protein